MSIDWCQKCDKRLDTDFVEYQPDGSLYCGACEADIEEEKLQEPDWKALAGELAEALYSTTVCLKTLIPSGPAIDQARAALAKYEQEVRA
jgi:hypothetical protein